MTRHLSRYLRTVSGVAVFLLSCGGPSAQQDPASQPRPFLSSAIQARLAIPIDDLVAQVRSALDDQHELVRVNGVSLVALRAAWLYGTEEGRAARQLQEPQLLTLAPHLERVAAADSSDRVRREA